MKLLGYTSAAAAAVHASTSAYAHDNKRNIAGGQVMQQVQIMVQERIRKQHYLGGRARGKRIVQALEAVVVCRSIP